MADTTEPFLLDDASLVPEDDIDLEPDEELLDAEEGIDYDPEADVTILPEPVEPYGRGWQFDFNAGRSARLGQAPAATRGIETLQFWIIHTLNVSQGSHVIYDEEYGVEGLNDMLGAPWSGAMDSVYAEAVAAALTQHDRIEAVDDFEFNNDDQGHLFVSFVVYTDEAETLEVTTPVPSI